MRSLPRDAGFALRLDEAARLETRVVAWVGSEDGAEPEVARALAIMLPYRARIREQASVRAAVEAALVEEGWPSPRIRDVLRALERLPERPKGPTECVVADADTVCRLGARGLAQAAAEAALAGGCVADAVSALRKILQRRSFTRAGGETGAAARVVTRELLAALERES